MVIAIDFGGTTIKLGLVHEGALVAGATLPAHSGNGMLARLPHVEQAIGQLLEQAGVSISECAGIGIATPGVVDTDNAVLVSINDKYMDAVGFSFREWAQQAYGLPFAMENDARAALLGEIVYGAAQGEQNAVLLTFGTGIGTAAAMNGQLVRGKHYQAGILGGHFATDIAGQRCNCGNQGCLEAQAGHWALPGVLRRHPAFASSALAGLSSWGYRDIIDAARAGDRVAVEVLEQLLEHWSAGIVNMVHAYDPETVILSGGLMNAQNDIVPLLEEKVRQRSWTPWGEVKLVVARHPEASVLLGLSALIDQRA